MVDGATKTARLKDDNGGPYGIVTMQLIDTIPVEGAFVYDQMVCEWDIDTGKYKLTYRKGSMTQEQLDAPPPPTPFEIFWSEVQETREREGDGNLWGEPVDEFVKMMNVLKELNKEHSVGGIVQRILRRGS